MEYASKGVAGTGLGLGIAGYIKGERDNMLEKMQAALLDEYEDVVDYCAMAEKADDEYKSILHTIAEEEWTHAKHLKDILEDMGGKMSDEIMDAHDEAHNALYK